MDDWKLWGPYLSERQWGTVREDYSPDGEAWTYLPHDHARSRAYRWGEDGLAGFSDHEQRLCLGLALWNGRDPILKERAFGLTGPEGNHGEDAKDYWWFLDATPDHAWNVWRYHYPQDEFPYADLVAANARRSRSEPEYELLDTGAFDGDRYWMVEVTYAKATPDDILISVRVTNAGPQRESLHVLPTAWLRNTWSWDGTAPNGRLWAIDDRTVGIDHPTLGRLQLVADPTPELLFCDNETNTERLYGTPGASPFPKDGINDHIIAGTPTVNPQRAGTKCAVHYRLDVEPGQTVELRLRLSPGEPAEEFAAVMAQRRAEADAFYAALTPDGASVQEARVLRQAFAGLLWSKQFYYYDVARWIDGDRAQPPPPVGREHGRNARWRHLDAYDIIAMPDTWEYPWFAAWDLAFHCVALAHVDPGFAKNQLLLLCQEGYQHPDGALPAYEWSFSDVNPPVTAWAALEVFTIDGGHDLDFLERILDKLLVNFTWWVNRQDAEGTNLFAGGFLGLDNIGPLDRSHLPVAGQLEQADATGWMAAYALSMATIAGILSRAGRRRSLDLVHTFLAHFTAIRDAIEEQGLWDETDGLFYDRLLTPDHAVLPVKVRSMVSMIPALAVAVLDEDILTPPRSLDRRVAAMLDRNGWRDPSALTEQGLLRGDAGHRRLLVGAVGLDRARRLLSRLFDEAEFLSPYGLRGISAYHRDHPYELTVAGVTATVGYQPAESDSPMFGGNSNWRGPIWFPLNFLIVTSLQRYARFFGGDLTIEYPTGGGRQHTLGEAADDLSDRLIAIFLPGPDGRRPGEGGTDTPWRDLITFNEYFHGDNGAGLGATHQTGWTALVADLIRRRHGAVPTLDDVLRTP